jgi:hypothetical protein
MRPLKPTTLIELIVILPLLLYPLGAAAEYRAYLIEVYDHISKTSKVESTGFSPDDYILTHGGGNRLTAFIKATWVCHGDTSGIKPTCPIPKPIKPRFKVGDRVRVTLEKHINQNWVGIVEVAYYQRGVRSNVYGVRFGDKRQVYNRFFEFNLVKADSAENNQNTQENTAGAAGTTQ